MVSWVVQSLLLSAIFGAVFCEVQEVQIVKNLIAISNKAFREHNATEIKLPDIGWVFEPMKFRNGRFGEFDTLELLPNPKIERRDNKYGTVYTFSIETALRDLFIHYDFKVDLPFLQNQGNVTITVREKSFQAEGRVLAKNDGTCYAILQDARIVKLGDFQVDFEPDDAPWLTQLYQAVLNIVHRSMIPLINKSIRSEITKTAFRNHFNKYVCDEVTRNSTTEAPTTYIPSTDLPNTTPPVTRRPYHSSTYEPETVPTRGPFPTSTQEPEPVTTRRPYHSSTYEPETVPTRGPFPTSSQEPEPVTTDW